MDYNHQTLAAARAKWRYRGQRRPPGAKSPGPGELSVWDFTRPPNLRSDPREVRVLWQHLPVAESTRAVRVCETAGPPTWYLPAEDINWTLVTPLPKRSVCEWKGTAHWFDVGQGEERLRAAAWCYPQPFAGNDAIAGRLAFYPHQLECLVAGERVKPQPGSLYGGWVTPEISGPFKGAPGTEWW